VLKQAEQSIQRELERRQDSEPEGALQELPTRDAGQYLETQTEADLSDEYLNAIASHRAQAAGTELESISMISDGEIMEIDEVEELEDAEDDTHVHLGHCTTGPVSTLNATTDSVSRAPDPFPKKPVNFDEPVDEDTSPFGLLMSQLGDVPAQKAFVRPRIEDPIAALHALEYSAGLITSAPSDDPFVDISDLKVAGLNQAPSIDPQKEITQERKITDVLHVDELES